MAAAARAAATRSAPAIANRTNAVNTSRVTAQRSLGSLPTSNISSPSIVTADLPSALTSGIRGMRTAPQSALTDALSRTSPAARAAPPALQSMPARAVAPIADPIDIPSRAIGIPRSRPALAQPARAQPALAQPALPSRTTVPAPVTSQIPSPVPTPTAKPGLAAGPPGLFGGTLGGFLDGARAARSNTNAARAADFNGLMQNSISQSPTGGFLGDRNSRSNPPGLGLDAGRGLGAIGRGIGALGSAIGRGLGAIAGVPASIGRSLADEISDALAERDKDRSSRSSIGKSATGRSSRGSSGFGSTRGGAARGGAGDNPGGSGNSDI